MACRFVGRRGKRFTCQSDVNTERTESIEQSCPQADKNHKICWRGKKSIELSRELSRTEENRSEVDIEFIKMVNLSRLTYTSRRPGGSSRVWNRSECLCILVFGKCRRTVRRFTGKRVDCSRSMLVAMCVPRCPCQRKWQFS